MLIGTALCAAIGLAPANDAPEWVHLLPAGEVLTHDGRGPYRVADAAALIAVSLPNGSKLALDENHSTDLAAPKGLPAPARGWIVELQHRADGLWGRVEWTPEGRPLARAYRGISPVIAHKADGTITAVLRASLTNTPNLTGLRSMHSEDQSKPLGVRVALLAQQATAYQAQLARQGTIIDIGAAVRAVASGKADATTVAMQARSGPIDPVALARKATGYQAEQASNGNVINFAAAVRAMAGKG